MGWDRKNHGWSALNQESRDWTIRANVTWSDSGDMPYMFSYALSAFFQERDLPCMIDLMAQEAAQHIFNRVVFAGNDFA
jgi:hypothetical protein